MRAFFRRQLKLATVRSETIKDLLHTALEKLDLKPEPVPAKETPAAPKPATPDKPENK